METTSSSTAPKHLGIDNVLSGLFAWSRANPMSALAGFLSAGLIVFQYAFLGKFASGTLGADFSALGWATTAWNPEGNQEHGWLVLPIFAFLIWHHRHRMASAPKKGSWWGVLPLVFGTLFFIASVRSLQPRMALVSMPLVFIGAIWTVWGWAVARVLLFPCAFLVFMVPSAAIEQASFKLQFVITGSVGIISKLLGIQIAAIGTTLRAVDGSFNFEIAEGCSGIRSVVAMTMLAALYVHLTQRALWKKLVIFAAAIPFAIIGNICRILTVILVAKYIGADLAAGLYHDYSGFIFFPFALMAMIGFSKLLNLGKRRQPDPPLPPVPGESGKVLFGRFLSVGAVVVLGLGGVAMLPKTISFQPVGVNLDLPVFVGKDWMGDDQTVSERELQTLGSQTDFSRKVYKNFAGDEVFVSVVLSGEDMNVSIHRPERCLPAQGLSIVKSDTFSVPVRDGSARVPVTRLLTSRPLSRPAGLPDSVKFPDRLYVLNYYWFAGYDVMTASHFERTWIDIRDRFTRGENQRWAYITVSSAIMAPVTGRGNDEAGCDAMIRQFIRDLEPKILRETIKLGQ
jgi:EpsI family protein